VQKKINKNDLLHQRIPEPEPKKNKKTFILHTCKQERKKQKTLGPKKNNKSFFFATKKKNWLTAFSYGQKQLNERECVGFLPFLLLAQPSLTCSEKKTISEIKLRKRKHLLLALLRWAHFCACSWSFKRKLFKMMGKNEDSNESDGPEILRDHFHYLINSDSRNNFRQMYIY
jgi:hypothetical protein